MNEKKVLLWKNICILAKRRNKNDQVEENYARPFLRLFHVFFFHSKLLQKMTNEVNVSSGENAMWNIHL